MSTESLSLGDKAWLRRVELSVLGAMGVVYMLAFFHRVAVPGTIFNQLQMDFSMTASAVAAVGAVFLYIYGMSQFFIGPVVDRFGGMRVLLIGGAMMALGCFAFAASRTPAMLYCSRALLALGSSTMFLCVVKEIDRMFGASRFTMLLSVMLFMGGLGGVLGTAPFERGVAMFGWRASIVMAGALTVLAVLAVGALYVVVAKELPPEKPRGGEGSYWGVITNPWNIPVLLAGCVNYAMFLVLQAVIGKKFIEDYLGVGSSTAALSTFAMMSTLMALMPLVGVLSHMTGNRRRHVLIPSAILALAAVAAMAIGVCLEVKSLPFFVCCMVALAVSASANPVVASSVKELNHPEVVGKSVGFYNGMLYMFIAVFTNAAGFILDHFKESAVVTASAVVYPISAYRAVFLWLLAMALVSLLSAFFIKETLGVHCSVESVDEAAG